MPVLYRLTQESTKKTITKKRYWTPKGWLKDKSKAVLMTPAQALAERTKWLKHYKNLTRGKIDHSDIVIKRELVLNDD